MQGLHIQLAAKPVEVRKSTGRAPDQSGFWLSTLITCIMSFRSENWQDLLVLNQEIGSQAFCIDSNTSSMCLTAGYWFQTFPVESKCFAILDEGSRTLA